MLPDSFVALSSAPSSQLRLAWERCHRPNVMNPKVESPPNRESGGHHRLCGAESSRLIPRSTHVRCHVLGDGAKLRTRQWNFLTEEFPTLSGFQSPVPRHIRPVAYPSQPHLRPPPAH